MGWNSWYGFSCGVDANLVEQMADAAISSGLQAAGYTYINLDDCWQGDRADDGSIAADPSLFPDGMKSVVDYVHGRGLRFGLYTDAGTGTCQGRPGSYDHEQQDANTYAGWGVDFVKVDWCHTEGLDPPSQYNKMRDALASAGAAYNHPMVYSICDWGVDSPWAWGPRTGNMWRTTGDTGDAENQWQRVLDALDKNAAHAAVAHPGAWNDPDALEVGLGSMSEIEDRAQFSMWAMMAAPLLVSNDLRSMSDYTRATLTNADAIAVDQDAAGIQGTVVSQDSTGQLQVWAKRLSAPGTWAVALFNRSDGDSPIGFRWADIGLKAKSASIRDIWAGSNQPAATTGYSAIVPSHGVVLLKVVSSDPRVEQRRPGP
jgi:alpha-galactosidase